MKRFRKALNPLRQFSLLILLGWILPLQQVSASHLVGGELNYRWLTGNDYIVTLKLYRDCSGYPAPVDPVIRIASSNCSYLFYDTLFQVNGTAVISPVCPLQAGNTTCNGGSLYGVELYSYSDTITLPGACSDWIFSYYECCRNGAITNLMLGAGNGMFLSASLDNLNVAFNNSCQFEHPPLMVIKNNSSSAMNWSAIDSDGDSLQYELEPARDDSNGVVLIPYTSPLSYLNPLAASSPALLDSTTGQLTVSPNLAQVAVVTMKVSEYRNGIKIGEVNRDCQVVVVNTTNSLPVLSGINGSNSFIYTACPGDTINFSLFSSDLDVSQILTVSWDSAFSGPSLSYTVSPDPTVGFYWVVDSSNLSSQPYLLTLKVEDDNCPYTGVQYYTYKIYVRACNSIPVWPGDADMNMVTNVYDLLPIGLGMGASGPLRSVYPYNYWSAQPSTDWSQSFVSGVNYKHADCNGDGLINLDDTVAILQNYGQIHTLRTTSISSAPSFLPTITLVASADTVGPGATLYYDVYVADSLAPVDSLYGLALSIRFDPTYLMAGAQVSVSYPLSFMGTPGTDLFTLDKSFPFTGMVDLGLTGIYHNNQSGYGAVARTGVVITDNISGRVNFAPIITGVVGVTANESYLVFSRAADTVVLDAQYVGVHPVKNPSNEIVLYPNPASDLVNIYSAGLKVNAVELSDISGRLIRKIFNQQNGKLQLITADLTDGIYILKINTEAGTAVKKLTIARPLKR